MIRKLHFFLLVSLFGILASGCTKSERESATGKGLFRGVSAIVDAPGVSFKIEERSLGSLAYGESSQLIRFDDLDYTFNFDIAVAGENSPRRLASQFLDSQADVDYLFVLGGSISTPEIFLWQAEVRTWDGTEAVFELWIAHASNEQDAVDVYFADPSIAPAVGNELGTLSRGEQLAPAEFAAGEYVLTLTAPGDPSTVFFTSGTRDWTAASRITALVLDRDPSQTTTMTVSLINETGTSAKISDARFPTEARIVHAALGIGNVDLAENSDFDNLLVSNLPFGEFTADTPLTEGISSYTFTDTGNQGATLAESELGIGGSVYVNLALVGPSSEPVILPTTSLRRPFATSGRIGILHLASNAAFVDMYILEAGLSVDDNNASFSFLPFKGEASPADFEAKSYEITATTGGTKTVLAGPVTVDIANGDVIGVVLLDTEDPNVLDVRVISVAP